MHETIRPISVWYIEFQSSLADHDFEMKVALITFSLKFLAVDLHIQCIALLKSKNLCHVVHKFDPDRSAWKSLVSHKYE